MEIGKETIVGILSDRGNDAKAEQAERELPDRVDTKRDAALLERFGVSPEDLVSRLTASRDRLGF